MVVEPKCLPRLLAVSARGVRQPLRTFLSAGTSQPQVVDSLALPLTWLAAVVARLLPVILNRICMQSMLGPKDITCMHRPQLVKSVVFFPVYFLLTGQSAHVGAGS